MKIHLPSSSGKRSWALTLGLLALAVLSLHLLCLFIGTLDFNRWRLKCYFQFPAIFLLNLLPVALLMAFFYFICNRAWISFLLTGTITMGMSYINYFKIAYRGDPFVAEDVFLFSEAANVVSDLDVEIPTWFWFSIFLLLAGTVVLFFLGRARVPKERWWLRPLGVLCCVVFGFTAWKLWYTDMELYNRQQNYELFAGDRDSTYQASH